MATDPGSADAMMGALPAVNQAENREIGAVDPDPNGGQEKKKKSKAKSAMPADVGRKSSAAEIFSKLMEFGKGYGVENDADFREAGRNYAEECVLISRMRDQVDADGLTTWKTYKTGDQMVAHPLIQEIPRHVDCANRTLSTICEILEKRGAKRENTGEDLDQFRM